MTAFSSSWSARIHACVLSTIILIERSLKAVKRNRDGCKDRHNDTQTVIEADTRRLTIAVIQTKARRQRTCKAPTEDCLAEERTSVHSPCIIAFEKFRSTLPVYKWTFV